MTIYRCICHHEIIVCHECIQTTYRKYIRLLDFVKSISSHFNLNENEADFMKFYVEKEHEAEKLLEEIGEAK